MRLFERIERDAARRYYDELYSVSAVALQLGYPKRFVLCRWIKDRKIPSKERSRIKK